MNYFLFLCFSVLVSIVKSIQNPQPTFKAVTKLGYFNATFTWKIEHFQLFNFGQRYDFKPLKSPILKAIDYSDGNKIYSAKFIIQPIFYLNNEIINYTIKTDFSQNPRKTKYSYKINENKIFNGTKFSRNQFFDVLDTVEISVYAIFSNQKNQTEFIPPNISIPLFAFEKHPTLSSQIIKMFQNNSESQFIIECKNESITAYKTVMKARSPIFEKLLLNDTELIQIDEFEPRIVRKMVEFCNFDLINNFESDEMEIFAISNFYQIQSLMIYAAREITKTATIKNATERYNFAVTQKSLLLEKWFLNFIITNFLEVSTTPNFVNLDSKTYKLFVKELLKKNKIK